MSDQTITLALENRETMGRAVRQLRRDGMVPAVIHDHGKASVHVQAPYIDMYKVYRNAGKHHPVDLTVDGKKYLALIKDATFEPRKNQLRHVVFNAINRNQKVTAEIPVVFTGDAEAEKAGYMILRQIDNVEVESVPSKLPNELPVDITQLKALGDKLHVSDIAIPAGVTLLTEPEHAVAVVEESAAKQAADAEAAEKAEAAANEEPADDAATPDATDAKAGDSAEA